MEGSSETIALLLYIISLLGLLLLSILSSKIYSPRHKEPADKLLIYLLREGITTTYLENIKRKSGDELCKKLKAEGLPNYSEIARELRISISNISNYIRDLENEGLIEIVRCGNEKFPFIHEKAAKLVSRTIFDVVWEALLSTPFIHRFLWSFMFLISSPFILTLILLFINRFDLMYIMMGYFTENMLTILKWVFSFSLAFSISFEMLKKLGKVAKRFRPDRLRVRQ